MGDMGDGGVVGAVSDALVNANDVGVDRIVGDDSQPVGAGAIAATKEAMDVAVCRFHAAVSSRRTA
jgi:hypothetical protein